MYLNNQFIHAKNTRHSSRNIRHGHVFSPESRPYFAWKEGKIDKGALNQIESGKFFPMAKGGQSDPVFLTDVPNAMPPRDGQIASGGQIPSLILDQPGTHWKKHQVKSREVLSVCWDYTAAHTTRRWNYFITKANWNPNQVLSRVQFEEQPFYQVQLNYAPFWSHTSELKPPVPTIHNVPMPAREGYHVLLAVWEVADTGNAFYQVIDLDFANEGSAQERPERPKGLRVLGTTERSIKLCWDASVDNEKIEKYRITRDGLTTIDVVSSELFWEDEGLKPNTEYVYQISAIDTNGNESLPSPSVNAMTLSEGGNETPPFAPNNLHLMGVSDSYVNLMWGRSVANNPVEVYIIYRDGLELARVESNLESYIDRSVKPNSSYRYFVAAQDREGLLSVPSNVLSVHTKDVVGGSDSEWKINTHYSVNTKVSFQNKIYRCLQAHTSNIGWNPIDTLNVLWVIND
ncbi:MULTISPECIES: lytic polysaccharide monooxygenase [Elizabethkingia]|uniref:lytic polysaccharide monooxygenase n=1 Tax=Elizabethkingia TaxID=308865 RepID=UPI00099A6005|nr:MULTISPECIES: lytic polysaccharide monooxygenase [Elizabethkingia]MCL1654889.1 lytic polysaccharide monooxygenase [Elizabethkingia miricola]MCL1680933.1 lytic polysaccharide monooxygenase [Elizabethkingia miricola]QCO47893.1 chitin-binding protein [Elizabethkingia sp. 2-6]WQM39471.1 lytic polysaccharide monooxygenase [Elizabethkingia miricola]